MTKFSDIKGFVFDLDGVITDTSVFHGQAWHQIANKVNTPWTPELADGLKGISRMDSLELILKSGNVSEKYTQEQKESLATEKNTNYLKLVDAMTPKNILPGVQDFLASLVENDYQISLASASKNAPRVLERIQLTKYFPEIIDPATLKKGKPDPEIYVKGAQVLRLDPSQCIGIEDAAAGISAINGAGETSVGIGDTTLLKEADINFEDTTELTLANIKQQLG